MVKRIPVALTTALLAMCALQPVAAQPSRARATADVDLSIRLKEVQANPTLEQNLFKLGRKVAGVCLHCHGEGGNSMNPDIPNLAGQNPAYLLEQLRLFATGQRRNEFMEGMIKSMDSDEKIGMVLFYSAQAVKHKPATNLPLVDKGNAVYQKQCLTCHGANGLGNEKIARIAGQQPGYLRKMLDRYRTAQSGPLAQSIMTPTARGLSDADVQAVVAFVSAIP
ncbi:Cytochrome c553 [Giesbergeria anulus]|uniref:Cytochrome c553 n=2 Tax=Giesbergeria anulus TaxID=180197 RepID=A0A1H9DXW8_9BURK|nr:Cytochrome c553 [Giesbergeria anulus]